MQSFKIDYSSRSSPLCYIGQKYDTDKSSQRLNVSYIRHCHPYTLFYNDVFEDKKDDKLTIAELGILEGASIRMWQEYFQKSDIYGFDNNRNFIDNYKTNYDNNRIVLSEIDVKNVTNIKKVFNDLNLMYDIIIEDTTHLFEDQINVINNVYPYLKEGGMLIIEDIFKSYNEKDYINRLKPILDNFQDYYFVELDHINKNSTGWNNDKLFILIKNGGESIFRKPDYLK